MLPVNDAPHALDQRVECFASDAVNITLSGVDAENDFLVAWVETLPTWGDLFQADGTPLTSVPAAVTGNSLQLLFVPTSLQQAALDSFTFVLSDGQLQSDSAVVTLVLGRANILPVALNQSVTGMEDTVTLVQLGGLDVDSEFLRAKVHTLPTAGELRQVN